MPHHEQSSRLWTKAFVALTICSFLLFLNLQMLLSSFPAYVSNEFQVDDMTVSLVTSVFAISAIVTRFITAALMKKVHRNVLLFVGLSIAAIITGLYVWADSISSLLLMRAGYGIGFGMSSTIIPTLVSQIIPGKRIGEGIGYFSLSTSIALSVGPIIGMNMMSTLGFPALAMAGAGAVLLIFPILLLSRAIPPAPPIHRFQAADTSRKKLTTRPSSRSSTRPTFNSSLIFPASLNVILAVTYSGLLSFIALYGEAIQLEQIGLFFLFNALTIIIIRPVSGKLFDRYGHAVVLIPAAVCVIISMTLLSFTVSLPLLILSALLYGIGFGAIQPTIQAWMLRITPPEQHSTANSMFYNSTDLGVAAGALLLGAIASATDYAVMYRYSAGFMVLFLVVYYIERLMVNKPSYISSDSETAITR